MEEVRGVEVPGAEAAVPRPLRMEEEVGEPDEKRMRDGAVEGEPTWALCWGEEEVVLQYLVGRVVVEGGRCWELWRVVVVAGLLDPSREVGVEILCFEEVGVDLLLMVEVGVEDLDVAFHS